MAEQNPAWLKRLNIGIYEGSLAGHYIRIQRIEDARAGEPQWNLYIKKGTDKFITDRDWDNDYWTKAQAVEYVEKKMRTQNGPHHSDSASRRATKPVTHMPWGFIRPNGTTKDGLKATGGVSSHDQLAESLGFEGETEALDGGCIRYVYKRFLAGEGMSIELNLSLHHNSDLGVDLPTRIRKLITWIGKQEITPDSIAMDIYGELNNANTYPDLFHIMDPADVVMKVLRRMAGGDLDGTLGTWFNGTRQAVYQLKRNGLHHLDSPSQWPEGWDDFSGYPWGFIKGARDESGLDAEEQVDNHDTLAMQMGYAQGEDAALDANWTRYLFTRAARKTAFSGNSDAAGRIWLNLSMVAPFWRQAQSVLTHLKKWEITPDHITCHFRADSDSLDEFDAFDISGDLKVMTGVFTRIAKGEEPRDVKKALGIRNPYQDSPDISDFGFISPTGTVYSARPTEPTHAQVAERIIRSHNIITLSSGHPASVLVRQGWVRYLYNLGNTLFMMEVHDISKQMPTIRKALQSPMAGGSVMVEDAKFNNYYGPTAKVLLARIKAKDQRGETGRESNPTYLGRHHPYKLHGDQTTGPLTAEFHDHTKYLILKSPSTSLWAWKLPSTGERGEPRAGLESVLSDLDRREKLHTGRLGGAMKFVVFSQSGVAVGTISAPDKDAAVQALVPQVSKFGVRTTQSLYLYPYISASKEIQWAADQGVKG